METTNNTMIIISTNINAPVEKVWQYWTDPGHIIYWNNASTDWFTPHAENDLRTGGRFTSRMEARDGSMGFDFGGQYNLVELHKSIEYTMDDGRKVEVQFIAEDGKTKIIESFEPESENSLEMQKQGWQSILDNFRDYAESRERFEKIHFEIMIDRPAKQVYETMLDKQSFEIWTAGFNPESRYEGSWEKGSDMRFLGINKDGTTGGMQSRVRENIPGRFISIRHNGVIQGDKVLYEGHEVESWAGGLEEYFFLEKDGKTLVSVDTDTNREFKAYFEETWPKALKKLKSLCED